MSVIINMELPESCKDCPIAYKTKSSLRCQIASKKAGYSCTSSLGRIGRPDHCPIQATELPEGDAEIDFPFAVSALLRATKKKPKNKHRWIYSSQIYVGDCPNCGDVVGIGDNFCHKCGQALDWSGT